MSRDDSQYRSNDRRNLDTRNINRVNGKSRSPSQSITPRRPSAINENFRDLDRVMKDIKRNWSFMTEGQFNPVNVSLALMDGSSLGQDYGIFKDMMSKLERSLQLIVNDYYQGFNTSIGTYGSIMQDIRNSQVNIREMRTTLVAAKELLSTKRLDLMQMWTMSQQYKEVIRILDSIEELKTIPEKLETMLSEKHFLAAVDLLTDALKKVEKKELSEIPAVLDLVNYLKSQENFIFEILIEELHNHLYLKSPYCGDRWAIYTRGQKSFPNIQFGDALLARKSEASKSDQSIRNMKNLIVITDMDIQSPLKSPIAFFMERQRGFDRMIEDIERNPETDSFYYIHLILESLAQLGKLKYALNVISQRLPVELYQLVDLTIREVDERHGDELRIVAASQSSRRSSNIRLHELTTALHETEAETLRDLLWTLFSKFDAVLQGHRVVHDITSDISKRKEFMGSGLNYPFEEIWKPIQSEVRTLLHDYLTDEHDSGVTVRKAVISINEVLRDRNARDRNKPVFRFAASNDKDKSVKSIDIDLEKILQESVPGLSSSQTQENTITQLGVAATANDERLTAGHSLLVKPDAFNISILFQPTLAFLDKLNEIMPTGARQTSVEFNSFLDDFVLNVFLPQLEDKIVDVYHEAVGGINAFQEDHFYKKVSERPIAKSTISIMQFIDTLTETLNTMPFHKEAFGGLIVSILIQYYQKCFDRYKDLISPDTFTSNTGDISGSISPAPNKNSSIKISAEWAQLDRVHELLNEFSQKDGDLLKLMEGETTIELELSEKTIFQSSSIIFDYKRISGLAQLYNSLKWFVGQVWSLRMSSIPNTKTSDTTSHGDMTLNNQRWAIVDSPTTIRPNKSMTLNLPLSPEMSQRFDAVLATFQQLAESCLFTLHIEFRLHAIWYLNKATSEGNYNLLEAPVEPDPHILDLNQDLVVCDESVSEILPPKEHRFMFEGIANLMDHILTRYAKNLKSLNANGVSKMIRNIRALQQNLKNILDQPQNVGFEFSLQYYDYYNAGGKALIKSIREQGPLYSFDEYKTILNLMFNVGPDGVVRDGNAQAARQYNELSIELAELMIDDW